MNLCLEKIEFLFYVKIRIHFNTSEMKLINYSDRSFVLSGEDTRNRRNFIKSLGGKWNGGLTDPITGERLRGWIFSNTKKIHVSQAFENFISKPTTLLLTDQISEVRKVNVPPNTGFQVGNVKVKSKLINHLSNLVYNMIFLCFIFMICYVIG